MADLRAATVKQIKRSIQGLQIKDFICKSNNTAYYKFLDDLKIDGPPDPELYTIEALAFVLTRPIMIISSLAKHKDNPVLHYNYQLTKPPYILGLYERQNHLIFKPFYMDKDNIFDLKQFKNRFEIVCYHTRALPARKDINTSAIIDSEFYAILSSLQALKKYICDSKTYLLCDSKSL